MVTNQNRLCAVLERPKLLNFVVLVLIPDYRYVGIYCIHQVFMYGDYKLGGYCLRYWSYSG